MTYKRLPPPQPHERLRWLAEHIIGQRVVLADTVPPDLIPMVFLPIGFGGLPGYRKDQLGRLAVFAVQDYHRDCKRAINGYPMFVECCVWRRTDVRKAWDLAAKARAAMDPSEGTEEARP